MPITEERGAIPHQTRPLADIARGWDAAAEMAKATKQSDWNAMSAWRANGNDADGDGLPDNKGDYKLPHHGGESEHPTIWRGVAAAMTVLLGGRGGVSIPSGDRRGVYNHLAEHYREFKKEPPAFTSRDADDDDFELAVSLEEVRADSTTIQTLILSKDVFKSEEEARSWITGHKFRADKIDVTSQSYRFRQFDPSDCQTGSERTITLTEGVEAGICRKKAGREGAFDTREIYRFAHDRSEEAMLFRDCSMQARAVRDSSGASRYEVAISSESEVARSFGIEILRHDKAAIDMTRLDAGAAVLVDHRGDQVGVVEEARIDGDKVLRGFLRFSQSQRGQEVQADVAGQIRQGISVGYFIHDYRLVEGRSDAKGGTTNVYEITRWQPAEVSIVSVPADTTVGVGRSVSGRPAPTGGGQPARKEARTMPMLKKKVLDERGAVVEVDDSDPREAATPEQLVRIESSRRDAEVADITDFCDENKVPKDQRSKWIRDGLSSDQVARKILELNRTKGTAQPSAEDLNAALPAKDRRRYSVARAILAGEQLREGVKPEGLEGEYHQELITKGRQKPVKGGILVPMDLRSDDERWQDWERRMSKRTLDSKTLTKGPETVFERPGELIELLRNTAVVMRLGARMLAGLNGPAAFTRQSGGLTLYWVGENPATDVTASDIAFGLVNLVPKTLQGTTAYSRQLLMQSSLDIEAMIREEFAIAHALKLDKSAFYGLGAAGEPTGIYKAPDVLVRSSVGVPDGDDIIQTGVTVAESNALLGTIGWVTTPGLAGKLMNVPEIAGATNGMPLWTGTLLEGALKGYRALATNQLSKVMTGSEETGGAEHGAIFGNWNDLVVGLFAAMELVVDPYAQKKRGLIEVTSFQMADLILRHGQSFCKWTGATLT